MSAGFLRDTAFAALPAERRTWKHAFRQGWAWGKDTTDWFVQETSRLDMERPVLHLCSGSSKLGDVRVAAHHDAANLRADMFRLPFPDGAFPVIVCDPPYELNLQDRCKLAKELARIHRPGGRLLWKAPWPPHEGFYAVHDVTVQSIRAGLPRDAHLLWRAARRIPKAEPKPGMRKAAARLATSVPKEPVGQAVLATDGQAPSEGPPLGQVSDVAGATAAGGAP